MRLVNQSVHTRGSGVWAFVTYEVQSSRRYFRGTWDQANSLQISGKKLLDSEGGKRENFASIVITKCDYLYHRRTHVS